MKELDEVNDIVAVTKAVAGTTNFRKLNVEFTFEATFTVKDITNNGRNHLHAKKKRAF